MVFIALSTDRVAAAVIVGILPLIFLHQLPGPTIIGSLLALSAFLWLSRNRYCQFLALIVISFLWGVWHSNGILMQTEALTQGDQQIVATINSSSLSWDDGQKVVISIPIPIAVNSNMRYDPSMRALKYILENQLIGDPVIASIDMRAIPDWQAFLQKYKKLELYAMAIHHIDAFRFLFGDPVKVTAVCRTDPRTTFEHIDGITQYTFQYANGLIATSLDDVWAWPGEPCAKNNYINWRVEGSDGLAEGDFGWHRREPEYCGSTLKLASRNHPGQWIAPKWERQWFPDAFIGTMANLMCAIEENRPPEISAEDNLGTLACIEACYLSIQQERTVYLNEILLENAK